jgi:hypothetical protein
MLWGGGSAILCEALREKLRRKEQRAIAWAAHRNEERKRWAKARRPIVVDPVAPGRVYYKITYEPRRRGSDWRIHDFQTKFANILFAHMGFLNLAGMFAKLWCNPAPRTRFGKPDQQKQAARFGSLPGVTQRHCIDKHVFAFSHVCQCTPSFVSSGDANSTPFGQSEPRT